MWNHILSESVPVGAMIFDDFQIMTSKLKHQELNKMADKLQTTLCRWGFLLENVLILTKIILKGPLRVKLITSQNWFMQWQQVVSWTNVGQGNWHDIALLGHNELSLVCHEIFVLTFYYFALAYNNNFLNLNR